MATHLIAFYAATAGVNGTSLGSDEEDIVLIQYLIWDLNSGQALTEQQYIISPHSVDINENLLSETCRTQFGLTEDVVKSGVSLETVIDSFEAIVTKLRDDGCKMHLMTDGQLHLRQVLHPKSVAKGVDLPYLYHSFFDLRKEMRSFYHLGQEVASIEEMIEHLECTGDSSENLAVKSVRDMCTIVKRMAGEGHRFVLPEIINLRLEPGICTRSEEVDSGCVVRARGLPWQSSDQDIAKFFRGLNIAKGGVALCLSHQGRRNGEALVRFVSAEHRDMALKRHKHHIGNRYIEVYKATGEDFVNVAGGNNNEAQQFLSRGGQVIIRMRGLPYDCTAKQVVDFFESGSNGCDILDSEDGVLFVRKPDGRATGDAFVLFASEEDSAKALAKHREIIGSRYIELFRSTTAEVQQVLNRSMDPRTYEQQQPLLGTLPQIPLLPQNYITATHRKDCIRLRGLPYEAQVEHVLEFLGEHAKSIVFRGVHMVINAQGQPSGEAFIQMDSEHSAFLAAQNRHHRYMIFGKKQRYIEVFQCSGEDMNLVLTGGLTGLPTGLPTQRTVVSPGMSPGMPPGMLVWDQNSNGISQATAAQSGTGVYQTPAPRPPLSHVLPTPSFPPSLYTSPPNGHLVQGLVSAPMKSEQMFVQGHLGSMMAPQLRQQLLQQPHFEVQHSSQTQTLLHTLKTNGAPTAGAAHTMPTFLGPYGEVPTMASNVPGMVYVSGSKLPPAVSFPSASFPSVLPQMSFLNTTSQTQTHTTDFRKSLHHKPSYPPGSILQLPYGSQAMAGMRVPVSMSMPVHGKRSFEQAFTDKSHIRSMKRPPPRLPAPVTPQHMTNPLTSITSPLSSLGAARGTNPHLGQQIAHLPPTAQASLTAMGAQMMPALYPPPSMYPPAM